MNGEATHHDDESFFDSDQNDDTELNQKIGDLESRNQSLVRENDETNKKIESLKTEIEGLRIAASKANRKMGEMEREIDKSEEERNVLEAIAARATELETEVSRLKNELVTAVKEGEEANGEKEKLKGEILEKGEGVKELEEEVVVLRSGKEENEKRMKELEVKLEGLEVKELEERNKKVRGEEEMRERVVVKEKEVEGLREKVKGLEVSLGEGKVELEKLEGEKKDVEGLLRGRQKRVARLEFEVLELKKEVDESEKMISGLKNMVDNETVNGVVEVATRSWSCKSASVSSGGAIGVVAVVVAGAAVFCYVYHSKRA